MLSVHDALPDGSIISELLEPDRWLLVFVLVFVLAVYSFSNGVVGRMRDMAARGGSSARGGKMKQETGNVR
jgi:branched-chain amino acid transport system permease protein